MWAEIYQEDSSFNNPELWSNKSYKIKKLIKWDENIKQTNKKLIKWDENINKQILVN
jgi:hypothetical protein